MNGHFACPPSSRGHAWREVAGAPDQRACERCDARGRVNDQGVVVPACSAEYHAALARAGKKSCRCGADLTKETT